MNVYVLDKSFNIIDLVDDYESCIWNTYYFKVGDFELYLPATPKNVELLKIGRYLVRDKDIIEDDLHNVMIIRELNIKTDVELGNYLTVTGKCLKSILQRRIVWSQTILRGKIESCLRLLINDNAINPVIPERKITQLRLGELKNFTETMSKQITGDNLGDAIIDICTTYGIGWEVYVDANNYMVVDFYKGLDRSDNQSDNARVTFSTDYDSLLTSDYTFSVENYKNVALVAGEGEGVARKTATVGTASDLERYEVYIDSRDSSSNDGEITEAEYTAQLTEAGMDELETLKYTESFEGEIEPYGNYIYGTDYHLGDIVNVKNEYGITATPRIIGVIESNSDESVSVIPTFSTWKGDEA